MWLGPFSSGAVGPDVQAHEHHEGDGSTFGRPLPPYEPLSFSTSQEGIPVRVSGYYHAYVIPELTMKPQPAEVAALVSVTMDFWEQHF